MEVTGVRKAEELAGDIGRRLTGGRLSLSVAESCTGGLVCHLLTRVSGSSAYLAGGIVAYSNEVKIAELGVKRAAIERQGAVSEAVAGQMARGVRRRLKTTIGVGITGIAGPTGGSESKPLGLVYVAVAAGRRCEVRECRFRGSRRHVQNAAALGTLTMLWAFLEKRRDGG